VLANLSVLPIAGSTRQSSTPIKTAIAPGQRGSVTGPDAAQPGSTVMAEPADQVYRPHVGVHLILVEAGKILLLRRANTGFADGS
jgi:hypothetical protein